MTAMTLRSAFVAAISFAALTVSLTPGLAHACACGCGVFSVGAGTLMPDDAKGSALIEYDFMSQSKNWAGGSSAPSGNNADKKIRTDFITLGGQYRIARNWTVTAEVPVWNRSFTTETDDGVQTFRHSALGDARVTAALFGAMRSELGDDLLDVDRLLTRGLDGRWPGSGATRPAAHERSGALST